MQTTVNLHSLQRIINKSGQLPKPETNKNHYRLYGHTLCPFVARSRYALSAKNIQFQDCQTDINEKSAWHLQLNNGQLPIFETPNEDQIVESSIIMQLAVELGGSNGVELVPKDPIEAAKMRIQIEKFNSYSNGFFSILMTRGEDDAAIDKFGDLILPQWEKLAQKAESNQVWLFGTKDLTLLDLVAGSIFEIIYLQQFTVYQNVSQRLNLVKNAPNYIKYVERFREHPAIRPYRMNKKAAQLYHERCRGWQKGVYCPLSHHELLDGEVFLEENI